VGASVALEVFLNETHDYAIRKHAGLKRTNATAAKSEESDAFSAGLALGQGCFVKPNQLLSTFSWLGVLEMMRTSGSRFGLPRRDASR